MDISDLLGDAERKGFTHNFAIEGERLRCSESGECFELDEATIVWSQAVDEGTDPGDDATIYLIETTSGLKGYLLVADSFHADPQRATIIDAMVRRAD